MPIQPDTKDWTWVLERRCEECGFDTRAFPREEVGKMVRDNAVRWRGLLEDDRARRRPSDDRWSCLEYACHVRDVFRLYDERLKLMLSEDGPHYPNWDQDQAAIDGSYEDSDPAVVANEIEGSGEKLAATFDSIGEEQWSRTGYRSDGASFTIESFARYFIHDPIHHLEDVRQGYERIADMPS